MTDGRDIRASAEVAGLIGAENLHRLRDSPAYGPFTCWHCGRRGDVNTEPATVIAELGPRDAYAESTTVIAHRDDDTARTALAHAECSPSQVVSTGAPTLVALTELGTGRPATRSGGARHWRTLMADLPGPDGSLPLLILDVRPDMAVRSGPDERVTRDIAALLSMRLPLVTTISEQLAMAMDGEGTGREPRVLPRATGWRFELSGRRVARLTAPDGPVIWDRDFDQPFPWRRLITRTGRCVVLIGAIGLYPTSARAFTSITTLLDQAADAGELVGGLVATGWVGGPGGESSS
jgi:hypothetical protein